VACVKSKTPSQAHATIAQSESILDKTSCLILLCSLPFLSQTKAILLILSCKASLSTQN